MFRIIKEYRRKKVLAAHKKAYAGKSRLLPNLAAVKSIGFLYTISCADDLCGIGQILDSLRRSGIPFDGIAVETGKSFADSVSRDGFREKCMEDNVVFISKDELDWIGKPKICPKSGKHYDLFLCLGRDIGFTAEYIVYNNVAGCLVAMENNPDLPLCMVLEPDNADFSYTRYMDSLFSYLKTINKDGE